MPQFRNDAPLAFDLDGIPALALRRERTWARLQAAQFLTLNEKRRAVGLPEIDGGNAMPASAASSNSR